MKTLQSDRPQIIAALVQDGHSPNNALEIAIDAERANVHAMAWIHKAEDGHAQGYCRNITSARPEPQSH